MRKNGQIKRAIRSHTIFIYLFYFIGRHIYGGPKCDLLGLFLGLLISARTPCLSHNLIYVLLFSIYYISRISRIYRGFKKITKKNNVKRKTSTSIRSVLSLGVDHDVQPCTLRMFTHEWPKRNWLRRKNTFSVSVSQVIAARGTPGPDRWCARAGHRRDMRGSTEELYNKTTRFCK